MKYEATIDLENKNNSHTLAYDLIEKYAKICKHTFINR